MSRVSRWLPGDRRSRAACIRSRSPTSQAVPSPSRAPRLSPPTRGPCSVFSRARRRSGGRSPTLERGRGCRRRRLCRFTARSTPTSRTPRSSRRAEPRVILATNIAETTLTVPDVTAVVDTGLQKVARYDADRGDRQPRDGAHHRRTPPTSARAAPDGAGRAVVLPALGRSAIGCARIASRRSRASISRRTVLDLMAWGGDPRTFEWFEAPSEHALEAALELLERLGAIDRTQRSLKARPPSRRLERLRRLPIHPRLGRLLIEANGSTEAARACALISERHFAAPRSAAARPAPICCPPSTGGRTCRRTCCA